MMMDVGKFISLSSSCNFTFVQFIFSTFYNIFFFNFAFSATICPCAANKYNFPAIKVNFTWALHFVSDKKIFLQGCQRHCLEIF